MVQQKNMASADLPEQPRDDDFSAAVEKLLRTAPNQDLHMFTYDERRANTTDTRWVLLPVIGAGLVARLSSVHGVCVWLPQAEAGLAAAKWGSDGWTHPCTSVRRQHYALQGCRLSRGTAGGGGDGRWRLARRITCVECECLFWPAGLGESELPPNQV